MKFFRKVKEIRSKNKELHFKRWAVIELPFFSIYIHRIYNADKDPFCHTHPWNFFSLILAGEYIEETLKPELQEVNITTKKRRGKFSVSRGDRNYLHRISTVVKTTTTLFITWGRKTPWYFYTGDGMVPFQEYIDNKEKYVGETKLPLKTPS